MSPIERLRVVVATPLSQSHRHMIESTEPRVELVCEEELLPPMRHAADFAGDPSFRRTLGQQERFDALIDSADVLYGIPDLDPAALKRTIISNPKLRWVHIMAAGGGGQVAAAKLSEHELSTVVFTTSAGVHGDTLAEWATFGVLAGAKSLPRLLAQQSAHHWSGRWTMGQVNNQTVLVVGLGGIGRKVVEKLSALGATVIATSRSRTTAPGVSEVVVPSDIAAVAGRIDAVVATLPGTAATDGLLGREFFAAVKPGVTVVNVGRGTVIDEEQLLFALQDGRVGFAALDVFAVEPLGKLSPFWDQPNVLISPHTAALSEAEDRLIAELFVENASRFLDGREMINRVNTVEFY